MPSWVRQRTLLTCSFTLKSYFATDFKSVCKQGVRGSSPLGSTTSAPLLCAGRNW
jgi:hypothetical protein